MRALRVVARTIPLLVAVLLVGVGVYVLVPGLGDDGPDVPDAPELADWPERVRPFVRFVERERGLDFKRVVRIDFLPPAQFEEELTDDGGELTDEDRVEIEETTGFLRAFGLVDDGVDLFAESQKLQGAGVVGAYSFEDERIRVRGDELTTSVRSTLVHELTHALQDQHFDIGERTKALSESDDDAENAAAGPFRAIIEGDASRVETLYVDSLPKRTRTALEREQAKDAATFRQRSRTIPPVLVTLLGAPYALGEPLLDLAAAADGGEANDAVDDLLEDPPTTEDALLDPFALLDGDAEAVEVDVPPVGASEKEVDSGSFGALGWYVVLAQRVEPRTALRATDGWGGDAYSSFERDGRTCVRVAYRGETRRDVDELADALDEWIAGSPDSALLQRTRDGLVFASCESDERAETLPQDAVLQLPVVRTVIASQGLESGAPEAFSRCYAQAVVDELTPAEINSESPEVAAKAKALAEGCVS